MLREPATHARRSSFDQLLASPAVTTSAGDDEFIPEDGHPSDPNLYSVVPDRKAVFTRYLALLFACLLSVGSHYASYTLAPLKSRLSRELGTSHTEFSLIISAFSLNSTWTPLVGGLLASRLGTTISSLLATGLILTGQVLLLVGDIVGNIRLMTLGMFVFGMGVSPLAVVQETIVVRFFKSHGLGVSMAFGLLAGKGASFISARTSHVLAEHYGTRAPFVVATFLAGASVVVNICYVIASRWLVDGAGAELEASDISQEAKRRSIINMSEAAALERVAEKRRVYFREIAKLGDVFWAYIGLNVLTGTVASPFTHLAANIIETRYGLSEENAAADASYLLAGCFIMYPLGGFLVDRYHRRPIVVQLLFCASCLTLCAYGWLALPPNWTQSPRIAITAFSIGHGVIPLLLVVIVPKIVALKYVSTALGVHKSLEQTGSTIFQTLAGLALDKQKSNRHLSDQPNSTKGLQRLLNTFFILNILQLGSILILARLQRMNQNIVQRRMDGIPPPPDGVHVETPLVASLHSHRRYASTTPQTKPDDVHARAELRRGHVFLFLSVALVITAWVLFMGTAWFRLGRRKNGSS